MGAIARFAGSSSTVAHGAADRRAPGLAGHDRVRAEPQREPRSWVVFPLPSIPSNVMNATRRILSARKGRPRRLRRLDARAAGGYGRAHAQPRRDRRPSSPAAAAASARAVCRAVRPARCPRGRRLRARRAAAARDAVEVDAPARRRGRRPQGRPLAARARPSASSREPRRPSGPSTCWSSTTASGSARRSRP